MTLRRAATRIESLTFASGDGGLFDLAPWSASRRCFQGRRFGWWTPGVHQPRVVVPRGAKRASQRVKVDIGKKK
jgi:hypothetical protein